ncbi:hypothetical protein PPO43_09435 [Saprospira sp. CCB-QB6]|uniref:hypothetical protein n=1 Tax=Saprospira sp. CCB-QB6 TaxID=3023936 RepID=UPI00234BE367|nr:hypothetical protein [Saprospira sp. CCB-QB6]WCL80197.1 hypothetical protein PPO43_09435 [Saprospira sp. CCB-QB6]
MKYLSFMMLLLLGSLGLNAQPPADGPKEDSPRRERMEALRVAYLTKELELSSDEAKKFWPVYEAFKKEKEALRKDGKALHQKDLALMSDKEAEGIFEEQMKLKEKHIALERKYHKEFKSVLPLRKVLMLQKAERGFKREMLKAMKGRHKGGKHHGGKHHRGGKPHRGHGEDGPPPPPRD